MSSEANETTHRNASRAFDLVLFGATGFTGKLVAEHLLRRHGVDGDLRWAIAGRSRDKLEAVRAELGAAAAELSIQVADSHDRAALDELVSQTRAVCSTVGPYALHGDDLVAACAAQGTDYCDLTGEVPWMRRMLDQHQDAAQQSGARLVHCCGFDSIPSDLGVWFLQQAAMERLGQPLQTVRLGVERMRGKMSGGTAASMINIIAESQRDPNTSKVLANPFALCPPEWRSGPRQPYVSGPKFSADMKSWRAPFVMAAINTRIVHKSHALQGRPWGEAFTYDEAMLTGPGWTGRRRAIMWSLALGGFALGAKVGPLRKVMSAKLLPKPGDGPSAAEREAGFFRLLIDGKTADGQRLRLRVTGDRDPGYGSTAKMLGEAAFTLATDLNHNGCAGGFWTPSVALGQALLDRLVAHAGLTFDVLD